MARKNTNVYEVATNQSLAAAFTTSPTFIQNADNVAYQINISTTNSTGTFAVQVSNDYQLDETTNTVKSPGNWIPLSMSGTPIAAAANDNIMIYLNQLPFVAVRLAYTPTVAGTGTCSVWIVTKQVSG